MLVELYDDAGNILGLYENYIQEPNLSIKKIDGVQSVTNSDLNNLISTNFLNAGYLYHITDIIDWDVYLIAVASNQINSIGYAIHQLSGIKAEVEYNVSTNTLTRVYDLNYHNWVENTTNIQNFFWGDSHITYNVIRNLASVTIAPAAMASIVNFNKNVFENCTFSIDATSTITDFSNNRILDGTQNITGLINDSFIFNTISSDISSLSGSLQYFNFNTITNCALSLSGTVTDVVNNIWRDSNIMLYSVTSPAISKNIITYCALDLTSLNVTDFTGNIIDACTISVNATTGSSRFVNNVIRHSDFNIDYDAGLVDCEITGVKSGVTLDTAIIYQKCYYKVNEYSTFYAYYDFTNAAIFTANTFYIPTQHKGIIGIFVAQNNNSADTIATISGFADTHNIKITRSSSAVLNISNTGNIVFPSGVSSPVVLTNNQIDSVEITPIIFPVGPSSGSLYLVKGPSYQDKITLTTTGTSGVATFTNNTLNIPQYGVNAVTVNTAAALSIALG